VVLGEGWWWGWVRVGKHKARATQAWTVLVLLHNSAMEAVFIRV